jgi:hypothetical protein
MACGDGDGSRLHYFNPVSLGLEQEEHRPLAKEEPGHRTLGSAGDVSSRPGWLLAGSQVLAGSQGSLLTPSRLTHGMGREISKRGEPAGQEMG